MEWIQIPFAMGRERSAKLKSSRIPPHKQSPKWHQQLPVKGLILVLCIIILYVLVQGKYLQASAIYMCSRQYYIFNIYKQYY